MVLLATLKALKSGLKLGLKVGSTLFIRPEATYTATLHTSVARQIPVTVVSFHRLGCFPINYAHCCLKRVSAERKVWRLSPHSG